ncbi:DUF4097 family beta strand repeat-containing protein [Microbacterium sp. ZXX196]|uniref:DUF4097 family beta strand repeat-containing protein n=1 Tax=Microbacterium sp. ZXX196 TaxID=2609291 RepID=UPI0012B76FCC|nr:DUF4097 family beta strand repeat-containing protein [Microbacterium sp. ZXX196]MTE23960.1 DUF4097 family beta strand repeat protein [Microbacterium sp. ZXX196]
MAEEKWIIQPGETRVIDVAGVTRLKAALVGGQIDIVGHDEEHTRIEVHGVAAKELRIEMSGAELEIDHPQLRWDNFLTTFGRLGASGPRAEISVAVPRAVALSLGVVSASALVAGLAAGATINTVSGDVLVDGLAGDLHTHAVSADIQVRGLEGAFSTDMVSGDVAVAGAVTTADVNTVSGSVLLDAEGELREAQVNSVSGSTTIRLDDDYPAAYTVHTLSGRVQVDGSSRSRNYAGRAGVLSGMFADVRVNSVGGDVSVLRRGGGAPPEPVDTEVEWPNQAGERA